MTKPPTKRRVKAWAIPRVILRYPRDPKTGLLVKLECTDYGNFEFAPWFKPTKKHVQVEIRQLHAPRRRR